MAKKTITYLSSFLLLVALLPAIFGFSLNKMRCIESGCVAYSFFESEDCCPTSENTETSLYVQCCEFSKVIFQHGISEILKQEFFKKVVIKNSFLTFQCFRLSDYQISSILFLTDTSPPLSCRNFLSLISAFRI